MREKEKERAKERKREKKRERKRERSRSYDKVAFVVKYSLFSLLFLHCPLFFQGLQILSSKRDRERVERVERDCAETEHRKRVQQRE